MIEVTWEKVPASLGTSMPVKTVLVSVSVPQAKRPEFQVSLSTVS